MSPGSNHFTIADSAGVGVFFPGKLQAQGLPPLRATAGVAPTTHATAIFDFLLAKLVLANYISFSELHADRYPVAINIACRRRIMTTGFADLSASLEDYLEAILNLSAEEGVARSKDIAVTLNVAKPSVTGALKILARRELVNYRRYGYVTLTAAGLAAAQGVARKHDIIKSFFTTVLGVDDALAHDAACKAEHALGSHIVGRLGQFSEFVSCGMENGIDVAGQFRRFLGAGGMREARHHD